MRSPLSLTTDLRLLPFLSKGTLQAITAGLSALLFAPAGFAQEAGAPPGLVEARGSADPEAPCDCEVWCALIVGLDPKTTRPPVAAAEDQAEIRRQLAKAFPGYTGFEILGESHEPILKEYECWVVPHKELFIKVDSLGEHPDKEGGIHVHLQIWHKTDVLVKSDAILRKNPIFFVGPKLGPDQLILALKLKDREEEEEASSGENSEEASPEE